MAKYVLLGELDHSRDNDDARPQQFNIAERFKHPGFLRKHKYNDIALLKLANEVKFNEYIRPACLPDTNSLSFSAIATGWGRLDTDRAQSPHLQKVELDLYTNRDCNSLYGTLNTRYVSRGILDQTQLCAGSHNGRGDTCQVSFIKKRKECKSLIKVIYLFFRVILVVHCNHSIQNCYACIQLLESRHSV